jgi:hypothetical protein
LISARTRAALATAKARGEALGCNRGYRGSRGPTARLSPCLGVSGRTERDSLLLGPHHASGLHGLIMEVSSYVHTSVAEPRCR